MVNLNDLIPRRPAIFFWAPVIFKPVYRWLGETRYRIKGLFKLENILEENQELIEENRRLQAWNWQIEALIKENEFLKTELKVVQKRQWSVTMARIFNFSTTGLERTALIDRGGDDGLAAGQPVIFSGDILLGIIKEVYPRQSLVFLITDPRLRISVKVADGQIVGRAEGAGSQGIRLELIANQEEVTEGQLLLTTGLDGLPVRLLVGQITKVQLHSGDLFKTVRAKPLFGDLFLENVFVIRE